MLAKSATALPDIGRYLFEPKWDGFRAIVFRSARDVFIQSRDLRAFDRYFPDLHAAFLRVLPANCVIDGEIVIATPDGLDFDALQLRLHPAASRVAKLARESPASFIAFDLLFARQRNLMTELQSSRRKLLEAMLGDVRPPVHLTPATQEHAVARRWLRRFEGAGLDGVVAKPCDGIYQPDKRAMIKVKHSRTADCVVAGFRWHKSGAGVIGSLLLGLYDDHDVLQHVGVTSAFPMHTRRQLATELAPLRTGARERHPWRTQRADPAGQRVPGAPSRWSGQKDLSWEALRIERVCEVRYDHLQGNRFRHAAIFLRWRDDKAPAECRYDQLETVTPFELEKILLSAPSCRIRQPARADDRQAMPPTRVINRRAPGPPR